MYAHDHIFHACCRIPFLARSIENMCHTLYFLPFSFHNTTPRCRCQSLCDWMIMIFLVTVEKGWVDTCITISVPIILHWFNNIGLHQLSNPKLKQYFASSLSSNFVQVTGTFYPVQQSTSSFEAASLNTIFKQIRTAMVSFLAWIIIRSKSNASVAFDSQW